MKKNKKYAEINERNNEEKRGGNTTKYCEGI